jgi:hypothetical protein
MYQTIFCRVLFDASSLPLETFVSRCRLWIVVDLLITAAYSFHSVDYLNGGATGALPATTVALAIMYFVDAVLLVRIE